MRPPTASDLRTARKAAQKGEMPLSDYRRLHRAFQAQEIAAGRTSLPSWR